MGTAGFDGLLFCLSGLRDGVCGMRVLVFWGGPGGQPRTIEKNVPSGGDGDCGVSGQRSFGSRWKAT